MKGAFYIVAWPLTQYVQDGFRASEADVDDRAIRKSRSSRGSRLMKAMSYGTLL